MPSGSDIEATLRALLAQAISENQAVVAATELPDIDPNLLLSHAAREELAAVSSASQDFMAPALTENDADLILGLTSGPDIETPDYFDVDFEVETLEGTTAPNERVRFQIGRQSPPRDFFAPGRSQSQDGSVVGRMGARGRFESVQPAPRPVSSPVASVTPAARPAPTAPSVSKYTLLKSDPFK